MANKLSDKQVPFVPAGHLDIPYLIETFGADRARLFLQDYFSKEENFFAFCSIFSDFLGDDVPDIHRIIISECMQGGKFAACLPRGGAKSTLVSVLFNAWLALNGKRKFILQISDTHTQASKFVQTIKSEVENNPLVRFVYPNVIGEIWTNDEGIVIVAPNGNRCMILPLGSGMKVRGLNFKARRPDQATIDDLENSEMVYSKERRKKLKRWFDMDLEPAMDRYGKNIVYVGTILHYHALFKQVVDRKDKYRAWRVLKRKAIESGKSFWESRFPLSWLLEIRDNPNHPEYVGSIVFAQEYQHEPQDDKDRIIQLDWMKEYSLAAKIREQVAETDEKRLEKWLRTLDRGAAVDPAISERETADFFAIYVMGYEMETGNEYMLDLLHEKSKDPAQHVKWVCDMVERWDLQWVAIESVQYQSGLSTLVRRELQRRGLYCRVIPVKTDKDKVRRARIHSVAFEGGFVHLRTDHPKCDIIKTEIEEFPLGEHDDAFDALMLARDARKRPKARTFAQKPAGF